MGKVVSVISQKGGVGKSTITTLLANILFFHFGFKVAILDADYAQFSIFKRREDELKAVQKSIKLQPAYELLYANKNPFPIIRTKIKYCEEDLDKIRDHYDFIFIDVAGTMNQVGILATYRLVNHFIIPVLKDNYSIKSAVEFYKVINKNISPHPAYESCQLFFNKVPRRHQVHKILPRLMSQLPFIPIYLSEYLIYETTYRNSLFPIPKSKMEAVKVIEFAKLVVTNFEDPANLLTT